MHQPEPFAGEEADEPGPSVESKNQAERITARRLRIAARNEAKTRQDLGEDSQGKEDIQEETRKSPKEVEKSKRHMAKLQTDGLELVTNIQVAVDARESDRRTELEEACRLRRENLENEAKSSQEKFGEITRKWTDAKMKQTPLDLRDALNSQQQLCEQILADKNKLISELQQELKASDDHYVKDLKRQAKDIDLLIDRMEEQISSLKKSYREDLQQIENSFDEERRTLLTKHRKKWGHQMKERSEKELRNMMQGLSLLEEHEDLLQKLRVWKAEEYNTDKIRMDTEVQNLRKKLQEVKFNCHLNEEKLDYKYEVVKKREEENAILKSHLKRKIIRMQDVLNNLKSKCANQEKQSKAEEQSLRNDYTRIKQQYKDMQKKAGHFAALDAERFEKLWLISEDEVKALAHRVLETDRIIHEQQLGLAWVSPPLFFMEHSGPIEHKTLRTASQAAADTLQEETRGDLVEESEGLDDTGSGVNRRTVKRILELLCDELGFLVESKLLKLVSHLEKNDQSLIKLDAIFSAIGIESEKDVYKMAEFLMNYRQHGREQREQMEEEETTNNSDFIHHNDLLVALKNFTAQYCRPHDVQASQKSSVLRLDMRDDSEDAAYWESIANVIPESKLRLWSALDTALNKYHTVLTERAELLVETQNVQQQNTELRQLLHLYTTSKASAEPEMQPTRMRQFPM
ncbi:dynein regulatory complex protein 1-like [Sinocyclocheilus anshuiensis]|uniref:dynein regulatory complex protein 1-like n=1 Tax=Sinocyclocheilus anshuiensis TaxID=1608454 RepID=UPI0007B8DC61|nr:PREDICTED: dynein regulatory complex protein 1-like [Sinocyclocheilus anshuiensis]